MKGHPQQYVPRLIAWEVTRSCVLACKHCRAAAQPTAYEGELSTEEGYKLLDNIASFAKPIIIITGGEPMLREDVYDLAAYAKSLGLPVVMAPCGMLSDDESAGRIVEAGIERISISIDGATAESHDAFRGAGGAFDGAMRGIEAAKRAGLGFQINTTVTTHNREELPEILELALRLGASVFNPFLLVPTGRGKQLADQELTPAQYEETLHWLAGQQMREDIRIRVTCAPHYQRILRQHHVPAGPHPVKGCMGGQSFAFISHNGKVQICGFLDIECGDLKEVDFDFRKIWETSKVFLEMRDPSGYRGRCGRCEFNRVCGGCRARAYAITGDYLQEEPFCTYQPKAKGADELDELDKRILSVIQVDLPVAPRPYDVLAERLGADGGEVLARVGRLRSGGVIRRIGAVFDSRRLGYSSTLVAARTPPERVEEVARLVNQLPGVTHNYSRQHDYNLWFTLTAESAEQIDRTLADLRRQTGIEDFHSLPALTVYKIRVHFALGEDPSPAVVAPASPAAGPAVSLNVSLNEQQKQLVRLLQDDLPVTPEPFARLAEQVGWPVERVLAQINEWMAAGVIRRLGVAVRHHRLGFAANGMAVFDMPADELDSAGRLLAERPEISHCYHRPPLADFPYNLFAMVHGQSQDEVTEIVDRLAGELKVGRFSVLFSHTEYKKTSMKYFVE